MVYRGHAEFKMPRNYIANDSYPMLEKEETVKRIREAYNQIDKVASDITSGNKLSVRHIFLLETLITVPFNHIWCKYKLTAKDFFATDKCVACGKCEKLCPLNNIKITDQKPVWDKNCTHCMACIGNCPTDAIEYGNMTQGKERYVFKKYSYTVKNTSKYNPTFRFMS